MLAKESFAEEVKALKTSNELPKRSKLKQMSPTIDQDGLLRVGGRINEAPIDYDARHPVIIDGRSEIGRLIVAEYHQRLAHGPIEYILSSIRLKFWLVHGRPVIKKYTRECLYCKQQRAKPNPPFMGSLPARRLTPFLPPFTHTIVDLFGPVYVKERRNEVKKWVVLFCCANLRAIHLEIAESLATDAFLNCFSRFSNRRGFPRTVTSDNGTNLVGADNELREGWNNLKKGKALHDLSNYGIEWKFIPPSSPHMNGAAERVVRSCKRALHAILHGQNVKYDTLIHDTYDTL